MVGFLGQVGVIAAFQTPATLLGALQNGSQNLEVTDGVLWEVRRHVGADYFGIHGTFELRKALSEYADAKSRKTKEKKLQAVAEQMKSRHDELMRLCRIVRRTAFEEDPINGVVDELSWLGIHRFQIDSLVAELRALKNSGIVGSEEIMSDLTRLEQSAEEYWRVGTRVKVALEPLQLWPVY